MYDFHKVGQESRSSIFFHPQFHRGGKKLLDGIKRKISKKENISEENEVMKSQLVEDIDKLKNRLKILEQKQKDCELVKDACSKLE